MSQLAKALDDRTGGADPLIFLIESQGCRSAQIVMAQFLPQGVKKGPFSGPQKGPKFSDGKADLEFCRKKRPKKTPILDLVF